MKSIITKNKHLADLENHHPLHNPPFNSTKPIKLKEELEKEDIIHAISLLIHNYIQRNTQLRKPRNSHCAFPGPRLFNSPEPVSALPPMEEIEAFIQAIFDKRRLPLEAGIIALILLNRTSIKLHSQNWMRLVLISLLLANKLCEDVYSVYNAKFLGLIPNLENLEINVLELEFLQYLKYRLFIDTDTYLRYYAKLQKFFPVEEVEEIEEIEDDEVVVEVIPPLVIPSVEEEVDRSLEVYSDIYRPSVLDCGSGGGSFRWRDYNYDLVSSIA